MSALQTTADRVLQQLQGYKLKDEQNGRYRANRPWATGSDSHALTLNIKPDGEHGTYFDHVANEGGSLYELADKLGVERTHSGNGVASYSKRDYTDLADYAAEKGVDVSVFKAAGWRDGTYASSRAIAFATDTGDRWRLLSGGSSYRSSRGYKASWYMLSAALSMQAASPQPLVLCNGEASVVIAQHWNVAAAAQTGGSECQLRPELLRTLQTVYPPQADHPILVALDCDKKGREAAPKLAEQLRQVGYLVTTVDLKASDGFDLADFCHLHGADSAQQLQQTAQAGPMAQPTPGIASTPAAPIADLDGAGALWVKQYGHEWGYDVRLARWRRWVGTHWKEEPQDATALDRQAVVVLRGLNMPVSSEGRIAGVIRLARGYCERPFTPQPGLVAFRNGTLDTATMTLRAHSRDDELTSCLPYDYAPGDFLKIASFLADTLTDAEAQQAYMAHLGLALLGDTRLHKLPVLLGPPRSGKSTLLVMANAVCGAPVPDHWSFAGPSLFSRETEGKRARAQWRNGRLVCVDELPVEALRTEETIKIMVAHGGVEMRLIGRDELTENRWGPKLLLATNEAPRYSDRTGALTERLIILTCPNERPEGTRNLFLLDALFVELPAFAAACIKAGLATLARGFYPQSNAMGRALRKIENDADTLKGFVAEACVLDADAWTATSELYNAYQTYCTANGVQERYRMALKHFTAGLGQRYRHLEPKAKYSSLLQRKERGVAGVRLRAANDPELEDAILGTSGTSTVHQNQERCTHNLEHTDAINNALGTLGTSKDQMQEVQADSTGTSIYRREGDFDVPDVPKSLCSRAGSSKVVGASTLEGDVPDVPDVPIVLTTTWQLVPHGAMLPDGSESKLDDGQLWARLKQSAANGNRAERRRAADKAYNDRQEELVRRALDGKRWRKAVECAGAIRGDPERQKALMAICADAERAACPLKC